MSREQIAQVNHKERFDTYVEKLVEAVGHGARAEPLREPELTSRPSRMVYGRFWSLPLLAYGSLGAWSGADDRLTARRSSVPLHHADGHEEEF